MNKTIFRLIGVVLLLSLTFGTYFSAAAAGNVYYVSTSGNDGNPGTEALPWRTIQKAANTVNTGDTVRVLSGNYAERVKITRAGTIFEGNNAVTQGFFIMANDVAVRGFTVSQSATDGIEVNRYIQNCVIENNYIYFSKGYGIELWPDTARCAVRNNRVERSLGSGIEVNGNNHLIEGNEVWGNIQVYPGSSNSSYADADGMHFFGTGHVFRNNYIHDIHFGIPENINPHIDCFQTWTDEWHPVASNVLFEGNTCLNYEAITENERGQGFMIGTGSGTGGGQNNLIIRNNLFVTTRAVNVVNAGTLIIENNTFISKSVNPTGGSPARSYELMFSGSSNNTIQKNIFDQTGSYTSCSISGDTSDGNMFYRSDGKSLLCAPAAGDLWGVNPLFVNPGAGDYHLQAGSPAIGSAPGGATFGAFPSSVTAPVNPLPTLTFTPVPTFTATPTPTFTAAPTASPIPVLPTATQIPPTPAVVVSLVPASPTPTPLPVMPTASPTPGIVVSVVTASPTPTPLVVLPTTSPAQISPTPGVVVAVVTASPTPTPVTAAPTASPAPVSPVPTQTPTPASVVVASIVTDAPVNGIPPTQIPPTQIPTIAFTPTPVPVIPVVTASPTPVPASPAPVVPIPPLGSETIYDDKNGAFAYSGNWEDIPKSRAYNGSHKVTAWNGEYAVFTFTGQSFSVLYKSGPEFRSMNVFVDGALAGTINQTTTNNIFQQRWNYPGQLTPGVHTLKLVFVTENRSGRTRGSIDAVIVR